MKLALLRGMNHDEYLRTTSAREVHEYMALNSIDRIFLGDRITDAAAIIANRIYNGLRGADAPPTTEADWRIDYAAWLHPERLEVPDLSEKLDLFFESIGQ